jgi:REP element-mobilizing transposase RayT
MSRSRYRFGEAHYPHFMTCTVVGWLPVFTRPQCVQIVLDSWQFLQDQKRLTLLGYVVMENHLHFIATSPNLSKEVGNFKSFTARKMIDWLQERGEESLLRQLTDEKDVFKVDRAHQLWQEGSHPKQILNEEMMEQKLTYIHYNPVRRGYVDDPTHWRYSSARNYAAQQGLVAVVTDWR